jgi:polar amino acid transport system substrate-binding protein
LKKSGMTTILPINTELKQNFAPLGKLRFAINLGNAVLAGKNAQTGKPQGVSVDLAVELARRLQLDYELITFNAAGKVVEAITAGQIDVAFLAIDPLRAKEIDYTAPYVVIEGAYMVRNTSKITANDQVDKAGINVVAGNGSAYDLYLTRTLKQANIVRVATSQLVVDTFLEKNFEVAAAVKQQLELDAARLTGVRLLPGRFMVIEQAMGVPAGRVSAKAWLTHYVEEMKSSGFVADALKRYGIEGAAVAAPS